MTAITDSPEKEVRVPTQQTSLLEPPADDDEGAPGWFRELQSEGWRVFQSLPMPARTDQAWRFSDVGAFDLERYIAAPALSPEESETLLGASAGLPQAASRLVFANDRLVASGEATDGAIPDGVVWKPLERALVEDEEVIRKHFMAGNTALGGEKFTSLHKARVRAGSFLYVPEGVRVELPLEAFHWMAGEGSSVFPHTLLVAEAGSQVMLVDHFRSSDPRQAGFACAVTDVVAGTDASVIYVCSQDWNDSTVAFHANTTFVGKNASVKGLTVNLGAAYSRVESHSRLEGEGARSDMLAVTVANGNQVYDLRTLQDHVRPDTASDLLFKSALADASKIVFSGLIRVEPGAHRTDAYQTARNLLLSGEAEADSMPGLEILADDVKCSHGSTTGEVSEEELFYLMARGIPPLAAKQLIVSGFLQEVVDRLGEPEVAEALGDRVEAKFGRMRSAIR